MATRRDQLYAMTHAERVEHVRKAWSTDLGQAPGKFQTALEAKGIELQVERGLERQLDVDEMHYALIIF